MSDFSIAHYRVVSELGRGGMGIVYRAHDTKLDRTVALKVLPRHALATEHDRARFYREARAAAKLSHAHICHVYQVDEAVLVEEGMAPPPDAETRPFIAMEFVDGETLADRIRKGPLRLEEAIRIATQVAGALGAAHEAGIVHRDMKPGNVMLTRKGEAKVLDFGLAKTTATTQLTRQGTTLGTVAYMSPEQARGEEVDARADLWALGVVLYEMVSGKLPFEADYEQATAYRILNEDPDPLTALRTGVPMELEAVVTKLLRKEARYRYQSAAGVIADLELLGERRPPGRGLSRSGVRVHGAKRYRKWVLAAILAVAASAMGFVTSRWTTRPPPPQPTLSLQFPLRPDQHARLVRIHPDNRHVLITTGDSANAGTRMVVIDMETGEQRVLTQVRGVGSMDISEDGRRVLFSTGSRLATIPFDGGEPSWLPEAFGGTYVSWGPEGSVLISSKYVVYRLRDELAKPDTLAGPKPAAGISGYLLPTWIVSTPYVLLNRQRGESNYGMVERMDVVRLDTRTGEELLLIPGACCGLVVDSGHILYNRGGNITFGTEQLFVQPFDFGTMMPTGSPQAVAGGGFSPQHDVGSNGTFVRIGGNRALAELRSLSTVDIELGEQQVLPFAKDGFLNVRWSPDGRKVMAGVFPETADAYPVVYDLLSETSQRLSVAPTDVYAPTWSPDGRRVMAVLPGGGLVTFPSDGSGAAEPFFDSAGTSFLPFRGIAVSNPDWSTDGRFVVATGRDLETLSEHVWRIDVDSREGRVLRRDTGNDRFPRISPDGRLIAYQNNLDGVGSVWVMTADGSARWSVVQNGAFPIWSPDGSSILFEGAGYGIYRVPVEYSGGFRATGEPVEVHVVGHGYTYDVSPDGRRLVIAGGRSNAEMSSSYLEVAVNWTNRLPTSRD